MARCRGLWLARAAVAPARARQIGSIRRDQSLWILGRGVAASGVADAGAARELAAAFREVLASESIVCFLDAAASVAQRVNASTLSLEELGLRAITARSFRSISTTTSRRSARMRQTHRNEDPRRRPCAKASSSSMTPACRHLDRFHRALRSRPRTGAAIRRSQHARLPAARTSRSCATTWRVSCHLFLARTQRGELAAASMFFEESRIVQYHLSAMNPALAATHATKLMIAQAIDWARARRNRWLHLGGGVGARADGVFAFKAGFSQLRWRFRTLRVIADETQYRELSGLANVDPIPATTDFFPRCPSLGLKVQAHGVAVLAVSAQDEDRVGTGASDRSEVARKPGARRRWPRSTARFRIFLLFVGSTAGAGESPPEVQCWLGVRDVWVWYRSEWGWGGKRHDNKFAIAACALGVSRCRCIDVMVAPTKGIRAPAMSVQALLSKLEWYAYLR